MARSARVGSHDPTIYPEEEKVGEESLQRFICELLRPLIERFLAERGQEAFVGADQFIYYRQYDAHARVAPDVYVLPGVAPGRRVRTWKTWITGIVPSFALEVVSSDVEKDYAEAPRRYAELGVDELVIFDPDFHEAPDRIRFQVFRRLPRRGLVRVLVTDEDRVPSKVLGCHLVAVGRGERLRLRIATGRGGADLVPTEAEAERAEKERERAEKERERAEKERERAEKERAIQVARELERELERERAARQTAERELARLRARARKREPE